MSDELISCRSCGRQWSTTGCDPRDTILCECGRAVIVPEAIEQVARDILATEYEAMDQAGSTAIAADIRIGVDSGYSARIALRAVIKALAANRPEPASGDVEARAEELFNLIYAHTVVKYDPKAGIRCCLAALQASPAPQGGGEAREKIARIIYEVNPMMDQAVDLDGRPTSAPFVIKWESMLECEDGLIDAIYEGADLILASLTTPERAIAAESDGWEPIESAPRDGREILMAYGFGTGDVAPPLVVAWDTKEGGWIAVGFEQHIETEPTHWCPLPSSPSRQPEGECDRSNLLARVELERAEARELKLLLNAEQDRALTAKVRLKEAERALEQIECTPAWGYPDRWETTPAEVRQLARQALAAMKGSEG